MNDANSTGRDLLRQLCAREGEALEAYGRALRACGSAAAPPEILVRDLSDAALRAASAAASLWLDFGAAQVRWGLALAGIRVEPAAGVPPSASTEKLE